MNNTILTAINSQINAEISSAYLYLSMAAYFDSLSLRGFAGWMKKQHDEEMIHATKFYDFVYDRGGKVTLAAIPAPATEFASPQQVFEMALEHEKKITASINNLYELAKQEKDYALESLLKWFIDEQVEEEATASEIIEKLKLISNHGPAILMLDKELSSRK